MGNEPTKQELRAPTDAQLREIRELGARIGVRINTEKIIDIDKAERLMLLLQAGAGRSAGRGDYGEF